MKGLPVLLCLGAACSGLRVSSDFEGGSGRVVSVAGNEIEVAVEGQADQDGRNRQASWYYLRVDGAANRPLRIRLTDLKGEYDYRAGTICVTEETPPLVSDDGRTWRHQPLRGDRDAGTALLEATPAADRFWIAHIEPYVASRLDAFRRELEGQPCFREEIVGRTVQGRPLRLWTITNPAAADASKKVVWLMARQHAWESGTSFVAEAAVRWLLSPEAAMIRDRVLFKVFPMMDPDGCAEGGVRFNRNGYDVNRNWDTVDPANPDHVRLMPEIAAAKKALLGWVGAGRPVHFFLTLHNQETGEWLSGSERHGALARRFFDALVKGSTFSPGRQTGPRKPSPPPAAGRASVHVYLDQGLGLPAFILEQGIARSERLGRLPVSDDRRAFGAALARAMAELVLAE
jgi:hypothetical protein